ncbi:MAG TPA: bifunctional methylenetetrahydrofolate dehydrogenase/methenyltetrahydrofolate cyclohydrolase FolD [Burkholderiales bacterium]|nr:bifunctional methylenetetrahydrofolate dehydrogenase/methenyltetrahydrofolate cyclohydrolase FolD [Burkholderiales bacterium]
MTAKIIDGAAIAQQTYAALKQRVAALGRRGAKPGLAVVLVGNHPASEVYVRNKVKACADTGLHSEEYRLPAHTAEADVLALLQRLNDDPKIHGILVQLPLPPQFNAQRVTQAIAPTKDVDGFGWTNLGALLTGDTIFAPCTPLGVMTMLDQIGIDPEGKQAVVIGRSTIVGKPLALMLMARNATVTVCHSRTPDLKQHALRADILAVAVGRARMVTGDMVKPGAVVIDVGMNRLPDGKLTGDVDFDSASETAAWITPVPGGVGRMTVAMLITNTVTAAERAADLE